MLILITIFSCENKQSKTDLIISENEENIFPRIKDTFTMNGTYKLINNFSVSSYKPIYIGKNAPSIQVDYLIQQYYREPASIWPAGVSPSADDSLHVKYWNKYKSYFSLQYWDEFTSYDSANIKIIIDTTQIVKSIEKRNWNTDTFIYLSYPVFIQNQSNSKSILGYGAHLPMILEVKDNQDKWVSLEEKYLYPCGNGLPTILLPKNEIIISSLPITRGAKKTKMRLKFGKHYSNEIMGFITLKNKSTAR